MPGRVSFVSLVCLRSPGHHRIYDSLLSQHCSFYKGRVKQYSHSCCVLDPWPEGLVAYMAILNRFRDPLQLTPAASMLDAQVADALRTAHATFHVPKSMI